MEWIWDEKCQELSNKLGTFETTIESKIFDPWFGHNYDFHFFVGIQSSENLQFLPIPESNNSAKKLKLRKKLLTREKNRYNTEIQKNKRIRKKYYKKAKDKKSRAKTKKALSSKEFKAKHEQFLEQINIKVNQLDMIVKTRIVKLNPTTEQSELLKVWIDSCDSVYNSLVKSFTKSYEKFKINHPGLDFYNLAKEFKKRKSFYFNRIKLRNKCINKCTDVYDETPFCVLANAIREFATSVKSVFTKIAKGQIDNFELKSRDKNRPKRSITIDKKFLIETGPYPKCLKGALSINNTRKNNEFKWTDVQKDFKIVYHKYESKFYLHAPILVPKKNVQMPRNKVVSLDPGENKFVAGYSLDHCFYFGTDNRDRMRIRLQKVDKLKSKMDTNKKRKWKYKKAVERHEKKMRNDRDEMHHKLNLFLVTGYEHIIIPDFSSKKVSSKEGKLHPLTKRVLGKFSHYRMRVRLQSKCEEYSSHYIEGNESYTTITCGNCGVRNSEVKKNKKRIYKCSECEYTTDRDFNGSRNIMIKNHNMVFI